MSSNVTNPSTVTSSAVSPTASPPAGQSPSHPVVAFIIGFSIIIIASLLNAGGLNITKLDHVRTMALPKGSRRKDYLRPLWVIGMLLYIMSQLIGSSLALDYMRAEYVAPLGSSSLIFNFLFASALIGTPITIMDIYGTAVVILGVIGIVAFGSINSGLKEDFSLGLLAHLWARPGWIGYFLLMGSAIIVQYICNSQLENVYHARAEVSVLPAHRMPTPRTPEPRGVWAKAKTKWDSAMETLRKRMETWTSDRDDKVIAWTLGIGWACNGGAMAGACLVFAKATVKLVSGSLKHINTGNQFIHPAAFVTFMLLGCTAIFQIICLNRALKIYDSTLVVPMFYAVYTASGFLNSLIFNDEVDAYSNWILFAIFVSIVILIVGVILLTNKKPEPKAAAQQSTILGPVPLNVRRGRRRPKSSEPQVDLQDDDDRIEEDDALRASDDEQEDAAVWRIGEDDDEVDGDISHAHEVRGSLGEGPTVPPVAHHENEAQRLVDVNVEGSTHQTTAHPGVPMRAPLPTSRGTSSPEGDPFADWEHASTSTLLKTS
ncbi:uncharacterized protein EI90DRAFT_3073443 [Cantharellus anzutake]|uniref:uncharacterized protein n=1 Tax=Cantharellus anzutake TaxID=1750568 RepID=UPI001904D11C|nr:uncharacterized protein EI90DRAFT_3073443 [Cantharellus anzutake]KAF8325224.1 hypothetical protein EI90DRAFT_3073443 [Cantharellus anzutake]